MASAFLPSSSIAPCDATWHHGTWQELCQEHFLGWTMWPADLSDLCADLCQVWQKRCWVFMNGWPFLYDIVVCEPCFSGGTWNHEVEPTWGTDPEDQKESRTVGSAVGLRFNYVTWCIYIFEIKMTCCDISYPILSYHIISSHLISYHLISSHLISYHIISYYIILYHIIYITKPYS